MSSFIGLVLVLVFFNAVSGLSIGNRRYENILKLSAIFNGKDSLTFSEYIQNLETAAGYKLYPDDINGAKIEFEKVDKNGDGLLKFQEMLDSKSDDSGKLLYFELADKGGFQITRFDYNGAYESPDLFKVKVSHWWNFYLSKKILYKICSPV